MMYILNLSLWSRIIKFEFLEMDQAPLGNLKARQLQDPGMDPTPHLRVCSFERVGIIALDALTKLWRPF